MKYTLTAVSQRITEALVRGDLCTSCIPTPLPKTEKAGQHLFQMAFEYVQGRRLSSCSDGPSCVSYCTHCLWSWTEPGSVLCRYLYKLVRSPWSFSSPGYAITALPRSLVLNHLHGLADDSLQKVCNIPILGNPELDNAFQIWSSIFWVQKDPHPWTVGNALPNAGQDAVGCLCHESIVLAHGLLVVPQYALRIFCTKQMEELACFFDESERYSSVQFCSLPRCLWTMSMSPVTNDLKQEPQVHDPISEQWSLSPPGIGGRTPDNFSRAQVYLQITLIYSLIGNMQTS